MSERRPDNPNDRLPEQLSESELIRCAADDELSPEQQRAFDRRLESCPEDRRRVESDRLLREAVGRVMEGEPAPDSVRDRVRSLFAEHESAPATVGGDATRSREFWAGIRRWSSVAAVLLVVVSVFFIASQRSSLNVDRPIDIYGEDFRSSVIAHVEREHDRCIAPDEYGSRKLNYRDMAEARDFVAGYLGPRVPDLSLESAGYELVGVGRCSIPGGKLAVQAVYRDMNAEGVYFSLFIQKDGDTPLIEIDDNRCYETPGTADERPPLYLWRVGDLTYYVITCKVDVALAVRRSFGCRGDGAAK